MRSTLILFNGRCPICAAEIAHYRARASRTDAPLTFVDLHEAELGQWSLTKDQAKRRLHARLPNGDMVSGLAAFEAIWRNLPGFRWVARLVSLPLLRPIAAVAYDRIAAPLLYRLHQRRERLGKAVPRT
ncbi:thiol-disulfide oxidoreductase DCC family protein [Gymnodinialimonas hymeniacidonis]|uniref:thiol-disulfide oxidoreductase DCC family protein n=1 Tax=Gymnodinialimonas hymeniacidonis TaxID=3126508 RepID=UPI0034C6344F